MYQPPHARSASTNVGVEGAYSAAAATPPQQQQQGHLAHSTPPSVVLHAPPEFYTPPMCSTSDYYGGGAGTATVAGTGLPPSVMSLPTQRAPPVLLSTQQYYGGGGGGSNAGSGHHARGGRGGNGVGMPGTPGGGGSRRKGDGGGGGGKGSAAASEPAPLYSVLNAANDNLCDWKDWPFNAQVYGNIHTFVERISPAVAAQAHRMTTTACFPTGREVTAPEPEVLLSDVWKTFHMPFGLDIPLQGVRLTRFKHDPDPVSVFYTPTLSGVSLTFASTVPRQKRLEYVGRTEVAASPVRDNSNTGGGGSKDATVNGASETASPPKSPPTPFSTPTGIRWFASEKPEMRMPMYDQMEALAHGEFPGLATARNTDFTHNSWFAVLWQPIHCHNHTAFHSCGSFLAFYLVRPRPLPQHAAPARGRSLPNRINLMAALSGAPVQTPVFRCDALSFPINIWDMKDDPILGDVVNPGSPVLPSVTAAVTAREAKVGNEERNPAADEDAAGTSANASPETAADAKAECEADVEPTAESLTAAETAAASAAVGAAERRASTAVALDLVSQFVGNARFPLCGLLPHRTRTDIWHPQSVRLPVSQFAPLFLFASAVELIAAEEKKDPFFALDRRLMDYYHFLRHEGYLSVFRNAIGHSS